MNHNVYRLLAVAFLNVFICGAAFASSEVEDDGHGDLHRAPREGRPMVRAEPPQDSDDGHGDLHRSNTQAVVPNNDGVQGDRKDIKLSSHL